MRKKVRQIIRRFGFLLGCSAILLNSVPAFAAQETGSIQINLKDLGRTNSVRENVEVQVYRVGTVNAQNQPQFHDGLGLKEYPQTGEALDAAAKQIAAKITALPDYTGKTNGDGSAAFANVSPGIYLIKIPDGNAYGTVSPFLVELPYYETVNGQLQGPVYQVTAEPKAEPNPTPDPTPDPTPNPTTEDQPQKSETESETESGTNKSGSGSGSGGSLKGGSGSSQSSVKTGDETPIGVYWGIAVIALLVLAAAVLIRINRRKHS